MIAIRKMTKQDIPQVSKMMCTSYRWLGKQNDFTAQQVDFLVSKRGSIEIITDESKSQGYLVACTDGLIVGVAAVNANELAKLFVDPDRHNQGIGAMLFNSAQQSIIEAGHKEMILGVIGHSPIGFYQKMGMSLFDEKLLTDGAFAGCKTPLMRKVLLHA